MFLSLDKNTELARAVDVMRERPKRICILVIEVNKIFFFFFASSYFLKEIDNLFSVFLSGYRNTRESLGELEKAARVPTAFLVFSDFHLCFYLTIMSSRFL